MDGEEPQGNPRVGQTVNQVDEVSDMVPACQFCCSVPGGLREGTVPSACLSVWERLTALALMPDASVPLRMPLVGAFQAATQVVLELRGAYIKSKFGMCPLRGTARESGSFFH